MGEAVALVMIQSWPGNGQIAEGKRIIILRNLGKIRMILVTGFQKRSTEVGENWKNDENLIRNVI